MKDNLVRKGEKGKETNCYPEKKMKRILRVMTQGYFRITTKPGEKQTLSGTECWRVAGRQMEIYIFKQAGEQHYNHI